MIFKELLVEDDICSLCKLQKFPRIDTYSLYRLCLFFHNLGVWSKSKRVGFDGENLVKKVPPPLEI